MKTLVKRALLLLGRGFSFMANYKKTAATVFICLLTTVGTFLIVQQHTKKQPQIVLEDKDIINKAGAHVELPEGRPLKVVRVEDETTLRVQNDFYQDVKSGDYIIAYREMVIIYRLLEDKIVAVKK